MDLVNLGQLVKVIDKEDDHFAKEAHILAIPLKPKDPYTLQFVTDNAISQYFEDQLITNCDYCVQFTDLEFNFRSWSAGTVRWERAAPRASSRWAAWCS